MAVSLQQGLGTTTHISGPVDPKRRVATPVQTIASRPSIKDPPTLRPRPEAQNTIASTFGFGISGSRPSLTHSSRSSRNVLRRKQSSIAQLAVTSSPASELVMPNTIIFGIPHIMERQKTSIDSSVRSAEAYHDIFARSDSRASNAIKSHRPVIPELNRWGSYSEQATASSRIMTLPHKLSTKDLPPAVPSTITTPVYSGGSSHHRYSGFSGSGYSASPSTRFSESPGPSSYSRDTTPTSMSSQSPGIYIPLKITTPRLRQGSAPTSNKPPVSSVTRRAGSTTEPDVTASPVASSGLSIVRESLTSSSSNSTVKGDEKGKGREREKKKKKRLSPLPPSPPPRKSSQRFQKINQGEHDTTSKTSQSPAKPLMMSSPTRLDSPSDNSRVVKPSITGTQPKISYAKAQRLEAKVHESKVMPPTRPSREGAQLPAHFVEPLNVIQSNLTNFSIPPNRRRSAVPSPLQIQTSFRPQGSRVMSRNPSPASFTPSREATPAPSKLGIVPDLKPRQIPSSSRGTTPSPSSDSRSRFGLFSRRTKTELAIGIKDKVPRKGPAAGTGHEGYGRYGLRGRSSSAGGQGRHERSYSVASSSQESIASTIAMHDPFLLQRMSPVIIAGGGVIKENCNPAPELYRTESGSSLVLDGSSMNSRRPSKSNPSHEVSRTTLWPSASSKETSRRTSAVAPPKSRRRPSDSSDDGYRQNTLALRRSIQRLGNSAATLDLPRPLNIPSVGDSPSLTSLDASVMSDDSRFESEAETRGRKNQLAKPKKLEKRPKSPTKWNLFQRSKPVVKTATPALAVIIGRAVPKLLPHYALMDSSDDQKEADAMVLEDLLRENDVVSLSNEELDELQFGHDQENMRRIENLRMNVPSPVFSLPPLFSSPEPIIIPELAKKELHLVKETAPIRPSRLPQVGRIPKVISARPETTSPRSFSRPFARLSIAHPRELLVADKQSLGLGPSPPKPSAPEPVANITVHRVSADSKSESTASHHDFLAFSPRQNSAATTSSSGGLSFIDTTAMIPAKDAELEMDEVWDEYDDLIENDDTIQVPASATSSYGIPFQYESFESRQIRKSRQRAKESPTFPIPKATEPGPERISHLTSSSVYSQEMSTRLKEALSTLPSPTTPLSFTDFFSGYGDRNNSFMSTTSPPRHSSQIDARRSTSGSENSRTLSELLAMDEQENPSPQSQVNLRVGSMTVSKWLTFGHVLFSPAKEEIIHIDQEPMRSHSILVIDGLGNGILYPLLLLSEKHTNIKQTTGHSTQLKHTAMQHSTTFHPPLLCLPHSTTQVSRQHRLTTARSSTSPRSQNSPSHPPSSQSSCFASQPRSVKQHTKRLSRRASAY